MSEQLSLFTIPSVEIKAPIHDPYWDEIECGNVDSVAATTVHCDDLDGLISPGHFTENFADEHCDEIPQCFSVRPQVTSNTQQFADEHTQWVQEYWVKRAGKKHYYYRYCWMSGRKKNCLHIGAVGSAIAKNRKSEIEIAIADGETPAGIQNLIRSWKL